MIKKGRDGAGPGVPGNFADGGSGGCGAPCEGAFALAVTGGELRRAEEAAHHHARGGLRRPQRGQSIGAVQPKPAFRVVFQVATTRAGSGVIPIKEPPGTDQEALNPCSWWRWGRVEFYLYGWLGYVVQRFRCRLPVPCASPE